METKRCLNCSKVDYGENKGLEKVDNCRKCGRPVCARCVGKCCKIDKPVE